MEAWVIKNNNGLYFWYNDDYIYGFCISKMLNAYFFTSRDDAQSMIDNLTLKSCKPVKVRIEEVENEKICD